MRPKLIALGLVLSFLTFCTPLAKDSLALSPSDPELRRTWVQALKLANVSDKRWKATPPVTLVPTIVLLPDGSRLFGQHRMSPIVHRDGSIHVQEEIFVFLLPSEAQKLPKVLLHEFLHALYFRRLFSEPNFDGATIEPEAWVCNLTSCGPP